MEQDHSRLEQNPWAEQDADNINGGGSGETTGPSREQPRTSSGRQIIRLSLDGAYAFLFLSTSLLIVVQISTWMRWNLVLDRPRSGYRRYERCKHTR